MKAVLISIKPKYCELIANGKKTIEVRKTKPKVKPPFKCYIYCTKPTHFWAYATYLYTSSEFLHLCDGKVTMSDGFEFFGREDYEVLNGKIIGEFVCDSIITVDCDSVYPFNKETSRYINKETCLDRDDFWNYTHGKIACGWHISNIEIYDNPRELSDFGLKRPPQSWVYVQ